MDVLLYIAYFELWSEYESKPKQPSHVEIYCGVPNYRSKHIIIILWEFAL